MFASINRTLAAAVAIIFGSLGASVQGQLVDFFDPDALAQQVDHLLQNNQQRQRLCQCARQHILEGGYDLQNALKKQVQLINEVMRG